MTGTGHDAACAWLPVRACVLRIAADFGHYVPERTIRTWVRRGQVAHRADPAANELQVFVPDVLARAGLTESFRK